MQLRKFVQNTETLVYIPNHEYTLCYADDIEESITEVHHENEEPTVVNGYQEPGSYVRPIIYPVKEREQFDEFILRSYSCEQYIRYKCWNSRLLSDAGVFSY